MHIDSFFTIGNSHSVCQDYAMTGSVNSKDGLYSYVILSDGCSSSKNTDIGSRLLCLATEKAIHNIVSVGCVIPDHLDRMILYYLGITKSALDLPITTFDATIWVAVALNDEFLFVYGRGDGTIIADLGFCSIVRKIEYKSNAPYYISYKLDKNRHDEYVKHFGNSECINSCLGINDISSIDKYSYFALFGSPQITSLEIRSITICSDGISSFGFDDKKCYEYCCDLVRYPVVNGEFVQRRLKRLERDNKKNGIFHYDDLSVVAMSKG